MIAALWTALAMVTLIALTALAIALALAERLRSVAQRVDMFLPVSEGALPLPGTPVPEFATTAVDGSRITRNDLGEADRIVAFLSTDCSSCHEQVPALRELREDALPRPLVVVIGVPAERAELVTALADHAVVVEEEHDGPLAELFEIHEFPAILLTRLGVIHKAGHGLTEVLRPVREPAAT